MTGRSAWLMVALSAVPPAAVAQTPAGPEFRANTYTTNNQSSPSVAADARGNFVVAWSSYRQDGSNWGIFAQRFTAAGAPLGVEFQVNTYTTNPQTGAAVASDASGNSIVVWNSVGQDGSSFGVYGQRFIAAGASLGVEFRINTYTSWHQAGPSVASDGKGNFVVAWTSWAASGSGQDGSYSGIFAQRFNAAGAPLGAEFQVNTYTTDDQDLPSVAVDANGGNFIVVWQSFRQEGSSASVNGIFGQLFSAVGRPVGGEFHVNTYTPSQQTFPSVASDLNGNFVVVWQSAFQDGSYYGVFGQRFSAAGTRQGAEFQVNTYTTNDQLRPRVASDETGNFVVTWYSNGQDGSSSGVFGQRFAASGTPVGSEFQINTFTTGEQSFTAVASDANGNFIVTWTSNGQDAGGTGVFGQRFGGLHPVSLSIDTVANPTADGNGVLEPGETSDGRPSWTNFNGAAHAFGGVFSNMVGPPGGAYAIADPNADYGTVPAGSTQVCLDCYGVAVSSPTVRPVLHWDATVLETITPVVHGQTKRWRLHIGDSFPDVPESNGFYRFVETLLHHSVTAGCTPTQYCPGSSTTREQMAVFVLVAKEGSGYLPPACVAGSEAFADVPAGSAFCPWVEELARRGVVNGCDRANYCPSSAVTREQMAVFVLRTLDPTLSPPACVPPNIYADVPATNGFCRWIEELTNRNVATGCGGGNYCPLAPVTREQMGVFISATFGLTLYGP